jgi:hypothetical protein
VPGTPIDPPTTRPSRTRRILSLDWWIRDPDGRIVLAQAPNAAIVVWLVSVVVGWTDLLDDSRETVLVHIGQGALIVWGLDELARGASPARRVLGAVVLVVMVVRVFG